MPSASLQFTQSAVVGGAGQAYVGVPGVAVTVANAVDTGVTTWTYALLSVPTGSSFSPGTQQSGGTPTFTFTPDVPGSFVFVLSVSDGVTTAIDTRSFLLVPRQREPPQLLRALGVELHENVSRRVLYKRAAGQHGGRGTSWAAMACLSWFSSSS